MQNLKTAEKVLKEIYLPYLDNLLGIAPSPLLSKIKKVKLTGDHIVAGAPIGLSGGFGYSAEGEPTPKSGNVISEKFKLFAKDMYVNICISQKAVTLGTTAGAMVNLLDQEIRGAQDAAKWNVGRSLFGNGTGVLCKIRAATTYSSEITTIKVDDVSNLKEGLIVDLYAKDGTAPDANGKGLRIKSITRTSESLTPTGGSAEKVYTVTLTGGSANTSIAAVTVTSGVESGGGFVTVQNSYKKEITGLGAIFDDSITSIYGVSKSDNQYLKPIVLDANNDISDGIITKSLRQSTRDKNGNVNMIFCGDSAYDAYVAYLRTNNIRVESMIGQIEGGFKSIKFIFGNREVDIVNESFVPNTEMWGVDTSEIELQQTGWAFAQLQGGGIFNLMERSALYRALLTNYAELICKNPGACIRITNVG